nr:ATPase F0 subunit 6 [Ficopomatus enigmaticus]
MGQIFCNKLFEGERKIFSGGFGCLFTMLLMSLVSLTIMEIAPYTILFKPSMFWLLLISVSVCSTFVISSFVNSPSVFMCSYIVPEQPFFLYLFLIPIEVFSSMLRPLTVALRMALNLTAGVILIKFAWCAGLSFLESTYTGLEEVFVFSSVLHFAVYVFIASLCLFAFCYIAVFEFLAMILHVFIYCMMIRVYELGHGEKL